MTVDGASPANDILDAGMRAMGVLDELSDADRGALLRRVRAGDSIAETAAAFDVGETYARSVVLEGTELCDRERKVAARLDNDSLAGLVARDPHDRSRLLAVVEMGEDHMDALETAGLVAAGKRRSKAEMTRFRLALHDVFTTDGPMTVRGAFYRMVARGLPKTEQQYARVQDESVKMRRGERLPVLPYRLVVDGTRWMRKPASYTSLGAMLEGTVQNYRRALWADQGTYVEIWCEKDALAGVLYPVTAEWDVPLMVSRGYSSVTFLHEAADTIRQQGKPAHIYLFTDRDRSGAEIADSIERDLRTFAPDADITCERAAVTEAQIEAFDLPTRPPKRKGDPPAVELDAIPPDGLRGIVRDCIERHVDPEAVERIKATEREERDVLRRIAKEWAA